MIMSSINYFNLEYLEKNLKEVEKNWPSWCALRRTGQDQKHLCNYIYRDSTRESPAGPLKLNPRKVPTCTAPEAQSCGSYPAEMTDG